MLEFSELKQAVDRGYIIVNKIKIVRKNSKIFDYVLPSKPVRPLEIVSEEKLVDMMSELKSYS